MHDYTAMRNGQPLRFKAQDDDAARRMAEAVRAGNLQRTCNCGICLTNAAPMVETTDQIAQAFGIPDALRTPPATARTVTPKCRMASCQEFQAPDSRYCQRHTPRMPVTVTKPPVYVNDPGTLIDESWPKVGTLPIGRTVEMIDKLGQRITDQGGIWWTIRGDDGTVAVIGGGKDEYVVRGPDREAARALITAVMRGERDVIRVLTEEPRRPGAHPETVGMTSQPGNPRWVEGYPDGPVIVSWVQGGSLGTRRVRTQDVERFLRDLATNRPGALATVTQL